VPGKSLGGLERRVDVLRARFVSGLTYLEGVARALDITVNELRTQLRAGKSVADLAQEKGVSAEQVKSSVLAVAGAALDQAVANGRLTAERAAAAKQALQNLPADHFLSLGAQGKLRLPREGTPGASNTLPRPAIPMLRGASL
jgi:hypothetical protein